LIIPSFVAAYNIIMEENPKWQLLNKLMNEPLGFSESEFQQLLSPQFKLEFNDLRKCILRIFDINENILLEQSDANMALNRKSQRKRAKKFYEKFRNGFDRSNGKVILAEGDSWFEFPYFIHDIIDHLMDHDHYAVYSLAYGGDWLTNIIYEGRYIEKLSVFNPDVFLVSGGGNDLVGSDRLGSMVSAPGNCRLKYTSADSFLVHLRSVYNNNPLAIPTDEETDVMFTTQQYIRKEFYAFMKIMELQYTLMFNGVHRKFPNLKIISQAYDYAIPSPAMHGHFLKKQYWVNRMLQTGRWLYVPLMISGVTKRELQRNIIRYMILEFNLMFARMASSMENVYHIDCRGVATSENDWYDELHLKSHKYKQIANTYEACIEAPSKGPRIYFAKTATKQSV
jgi:hypothetical protein